MKEPRRLLTIKETAHRLGLAKQTIYNGITRESKKPFPLKPKRWGRKVLFDSLDVEAFIESLPYSDSSALDS